MSNTLVIYAVAALGGIAVTIQSQMMGVLDRGVGTLESVFITYGGGGLLIGLLMLAMRGGNLSAWTSVPVYTLFAGAVGLVIVGSISYSVPRLGLVTAFTVMIATQFLVGALLDHYGLLGAELRRLTLPRAGGIAVMLAGVWLTISN
jgi:transporter family-2 protein